MSRPPWLTWGRLIGFVIFGLCLFNPTTRLLALAYGIGWVVVECVRIVSRSSGPTDKGGDQR